MIIVTGAALIAIRAAIISMLPWMAKHWRLMTVATNAIITTFDQLQVVVDVIIDAIKLSILLLTDGKHPKHLAMNFKKLPFVDGRAVHDDLVDLARTCTAHTSGREIMEFVLKDALNPYVCPLVRSLQPTVLDEVSRVPTAWLTYSVKPDDGVRGCTAPQQDTTADWICVGLGTGYVLIEIFIPVILCALLAYHFIRGVIAIGRK